MAPTNSRRASRFEADFVEALDAACERVRFLPATRKRESRVRQDPEIHSCVWHGDTWGLTARCRDGQRTDDEFQLRLRFDPHAERDLVQVVCSCAGQAADQRCRHERALLEHVRDMFDALPGQRPALAATITASFGEDAWRYSIEQLRHLAATQPSQREHDDEGRIPSYRVRLLSGARRVRVRVHAFAQERTPSSRPTPRRITWARWLSEFGAAGPLHEHVRGLLIPYARQVDGGQFTRQIEDGIDTGSILAHLIGSTRCTWHDAPTQPIAVERGTLGLAVERTASHDRLTVKVSLGDASLARGQLVKLDAHHLATVQRDAHRIVVSTRLDPALVTGVLMLGDGESTFPADQADSLMRSLSELTRSRVGVHFDVDPRLVTATLAGDDRPLVWVEAIDGGGIGIRLFASPHPLVTHLPPGHGPASMYVTDGDRLARVERHLASEIEAAQRLAHDLGLSLPHDDDDPWTRWGTVVVDEQRFVACVARLQALGSSIHVRWSTTPLTVRTATAPDLVLRIRRSGAWFEFDGDASIDGRTIALTDLVQAIEHDKSYVELSPGQYIAMGDKLTAMLRKVAALGVQKGAAVRVPELAHAWLADELNGATVVEACDEWRRRCRELEVAVVDATAMPNVDATLRSYQLAGYRWLARLAAWGIGACLADDMGLGKTLQTLAVLSDRAGIGPALVVAPVSVAENWRQELERFAPALEHRLYHGPDRAAQLESLAPNTVVVTSYGVLQRDTAALGQIEWASLVLDEAQFVKNPSSKVAQAARRVPAAWKLALTGTPVQNRLADLWSLFRIVAPGLLGSLDQFQSRFVVPIEQHGDTRRRRFLGDLLAPVLLRRRKEDVLTELPPATESVRYVELTPPEVELYEQTRRQVVTGLERLGNSSDRRMEVLRALTRLRQLACHPVLVKASWKQGSAKLRALLELVSELALAGHTALIFSQFTSLLDQIGPALEQANYVYSRLDGTMPAAARQTAIDAFQQGEVDVMLISLRAGGTGLNLTRASYVILVDPWWNPAVEDQALGRAHRIGSAGPVHLVRLVARGTVEQKVLAMHAHKRSLAEGLMTDARRVESSDVDELVEMLRESALALGSNDKLTAQLRQQVVR